MDVHSVNIRIMECMLTSDVLKSIPIVEDWYCIACNVDVGIGDVRNIGSYSHSMVKMRSRKRRDIGENKINLGEV